MLIQQDEELKDSMRFSRMECLGNDAVTPMTLNTLESDLSNQPITRQSTVSTSSKNSKKNKKKKNKK